MDNHVIKYIANYQHYDDVLTRIASVKHTLWIGTADIKDTYVKTGSNDCQIQALFGMWWYQTGNKNQP